MTESVPQQVVQPQPTPESWQIQILPNQMIVIIISSVTGTHVSFLDADSASQLSVDLAGVARQAKSGLIIPQGDFKLPPAQPNGNHAQ